MQRFFRIGHAAPSALILAAVVAIALSSCYTSPDPARLKLARSPRGIEARFALTDRSPGRTELLAVTDTGFVVLREGRVVFLRYDRIRRARLQTVGLLAMNGATPDRGLRERLAYLSRYPFGVPDAALVELMRNAGQQAPDTIRARDR